VAGLAVELDIHQVHPARSVWRVTLRATLKDEYVGHDVGAGGRAHAGLGQPHGADQVGHRGDVLARGPARFVHRAGAGHEEGDAARAQPCNRAGDEVVVQAQAKSCGRPIRANDAVRKRRIADREVETAAEPAARVILAPDPRLGMRQARDPGSDWAVFDTG
jgi:hypothetical protein